MNTKRKIDGEERPNRFIENFGEKYGEIWGIGEKFINIFVSLRELLGSHM